MSGGRKLLVALRDLPVYALSYLFMLLAAILSDFTITSLALGAVALGFAVQSLLWPLAAFFFIFVVIRAINSIANAIGVTGQSVTRTAQSIAQIMAYPPHNG